jgi:hypothetical protein
MKKALLWSFVAILIGAAGSGIAYGLSLLIPKILYG